MTFLKQFKNWKKNDVLLLLELKRFSFIPYFLFLFAMTGCGTWPGTQLSRDRDISWDQLCFRPQGRARITQGAEKNLLALESLFWPEQKKWSVALSAPVYGEKIFSIDWSQGAPGLSHADFEAFQWSRSQQELMKELTRFLASVLESSKQNKCDLKSPAAAFSRGQCPLPAPALIAPSFQQTEKGIDFLFTTKQGARLVWSHQLDHTGDSKTGNQTITLFPAKQQEDRGPLWSMELFLSRCEENEPVQNS